ncbi:Mediator of RNA polymerase II transcription subunit 16 [Sporothrix epigloea]|uniref:Mediator of RNA polymerase II transcription subunit 16 n=1 Tax=Sporothrix epigloea TaxID=1892477 RepID=A0ABP0DCF8_9PEZI
MTDDVPLVIDDAMTAIPGMSADVQVNLGDVDVDVDDVDLFGAAVEVPLPSYSPPSKPLLLCVNEQRIRGCNQRIAWSKQGTLATIGADGQSIDMQYLQTDPETAAWGLSEATSHDQFSLATTPTNFLGGPIVHLCWSAAGQPELAVVDSVGRISILAFSATLNRPFCIRSWDSDPIDDLHAVVATYWLPIMPPNKQFNLIYGPAVLDNGSYKYENTLVPVSGPYHPYPSKSALLCVSVGGTLRLLFLQSNNMVQDTSIELENITSSDDLVTHASICSEKNMLLVALVTASRKLKVLRAAIGWNPTQAEKQASHQIQQLNPILQQKSAAVTTLLQRNDGETQLDISSALASHVKILPSALLAGTNQWTPPLVIVVRDYLPTADTANVSPEPQSIINRWELLVETPLQSIHPAFEQLGFKPNEANIKQANQGVSRLHKLPTITINKLIVSVQTTQHGRVICFFFSDGTQQCRDRFTFEEIYDESNPARISSLQHAGFQFVDPKPCLSVALSPTACSLAQVCLDGKVTWSSLKYMGADSATSGQDPNYAAVVAALSSAVSTASSSYISYDDVLAIARQFIDRPRFAYDWIAEMIRILKINVDYSEDTHHEQLVRNNTLHTCLGILNQLGFHGDIRPRSFFGKFSMLALNVRNIVILITIASNTPSNLKDKISPLEEPDVVSALAGCAKWALDFLAYTCDCIFNLLDDAKFMSFLTGSNFSGLIPYLQEKNEVALHLILCSSTRGFLSAACRRLLHLDAISSRAIQMKEQQQQQAAANGNSLLTPAIIASYYKMQQYTSSSLIQVQEFDKLLWMLGDEIRQAYQSKTGENVAVKKQEQGQSPAVDLDAKRSQAHSEQALLLLQDMPSNFQPILYKFFNESLRSFRALTDPARLYFADYSILEVDEDSRSLQEKRARRAHIDVFKRVPLTSLGPSSGNGAASAPPGYLRRCVRCAAIMEDIAATRPYNIVLAQQRKCSCSGHWGLLPRSAVFG